MKRILCAVLLLAVLFVIVSCAITDTPTTPSTSTPTASSEPTAEPTTASASEPTAEPTEAPTEAPTEEPTEEPTPVPTEPITGPEVEEGKPYFIKVNNQCNTVTVYTKGEDGCYTTPYKAMICSTGTATPQSGTYTLKYKWKGLGLFGDVYGYYVTQITGNILFHSVPYTTPIRDSQGYIVSVDPSTLEYWEFDKLGTAASMGCIRLQVVDAKWIYDHRDEIAGVEFYNSEVPGPLGKPEAPKISDNEECRGWDPTDPDPDNPWNKTN